MPSIETSWERSNIAAENLVRDLLAEAGLTNYSGATSSFTFGTQGPAQFNMVSVMDAIEQINHILAYNIYMNGSTVTWARVTPEPTGSPSYTLDKFINISKTTGTKNLRNKVVVFGKNGIYAEASAVSPYLPANFYQTAIVSSELIDTQSMASQSAPYNLALYNRLDQELKVDIEGDPRIKVMQTVHVTHAPLGIDDDWFVFSLRHYVEDTFVTSLTLRK